MSNKRKLKRIILIVLAVIVVLGLLIFIYERNAWRLENAKYGLKTIVKSVSPTSVIFNVECSGEKENNSLYIENEDGFYLEKWTILGWESVEYLDEEGYMPVGLENYYIDERVIHKVGVGWKLIYGDLANGTYRMKVPIYKENESPQQDELVDYCCAVFEVSH